MDQVSRWKAAIPDELQVLRQWVLWRYGDARPNGKRVKRPISPEGKAVKVSDSQTWSTFDTVVEAYQAGAFDGIGFVFTEEDPFVGIDCDGMLFDGKPVDEGAWVLDQLGSVYAEISPSGKGFKAIVRGKLPKGKRNRCDLGPGRGVEIYDRKRFFTVGGEKLPGSVSEVPERQVALDLIHSRFFPQRSATRRQKSSRPFYAEASEERIHEILESLFSDNRPVVQSDVQGPPGDGRHPSPSHRDLAMCTWLVQHGANSPALIDACYRRLPGARACDKWDRDAYRIATCNKALERRPPVILNCPRPEPERISLAEYQAQMEHARFDLLGDEGVFLDHSFTGAGKTFQDVKLIAWLGEGLILAPTHDNCREIHRALVDARQQLGERGDDEVGLAPQLSDWNCVEHAKAKRAQAAQLSVDEVVCRGCPLKVACRDGSNVVGDQPGYIYLRDQARQKPMLVATQERGARGLERLIGDRKIVAIHENPERILRRTETLRAADLERLIDVLGEHARRGPSGSLTAILTAAKSLRRGLRQRKKTGAVRSATEPMRLSDSQAKQLVQTAHEDAASGASLSFLISYCRSKVDEVNIVFPQPPKHLDSPLAPEPLLQFVWKATLPEGKTYLIGDATSESRSMEKLLGQSVTDITPAGLPYPQAKIEQYRIDITRGGSIGEVAKLLRGALLLNSESRRVGVIGHSNHVNPLQASSSLEPEFRKRIVRWSYFGSGEDKSNNKWHQKCDLLIVLGTPRRKAGDLQLQLAGRGTPTQDGDWGPVRHETPDGVFEYNVYRDPHWREIYDQTVRADLVQAIGRGRTYTSVAIPVVVFTNQYLALPDVTYAEVEKEPTVNRKQFAVLQTLKPMHECGTSFTLATPSRGNSLVYTGGGGVADENAGKSVYNNKGIRPALSLRRNQETSESGGIPLREIMLRVIKKHGDDIGEASVRKALQHLRAFKLAAQRGKGPSSRWGWTERAWLFFDGQADE